MFDLWAQTAGDRGLFLSDSTLLKIVCMNLFAHAPHFLDRVMIFKPDHFNILILKILNLEEKAEKEAKSIIHEQ